jgi:hypothetical protein
VRKNSARIAGDNDQILDPNAAYPTTIEPRLDCHHLIDTQNCCATGRKDGLLVDIQAYSMPCAMNVLVVNALPQKYCPRCRVYSRTNGSGLH